LNEKLTLSLAYLSGISFNEINTENILTVVSSLSIPQILILTITGSLLLSNIKFKNWRDKIPIYLFTYINAKNTVSRYATLKDICITSDAPNADA
jgi:hypothetical protein